MSMTIERIYRQLGDASREISQAFRIVITEEQINALNDLGNALTRHQEELSHSKAMAPPIHQNKQVDKVAPHKAINRRGKFKRSSRK